MASLSVYFLSNSFMLPFAAGIVVFSLVRLWALMIYEDVFNEWILRPGEDILEVKYTWRDHIGPIFYAIGVEIIAVSLGIVFLTDFTGWVLAYLVAACLLPPAHKDVNGDRKERYRRRLMAAHGWF